MPGRLSDYPSKNNVVCAPPASARSHSADKHAQLCCDIMLHY